METQLTPEQQKVRDKFKKQQVKIVDSICNRILMQFSFKNIKTWRDVYRATGYDDKFVGPNDDKLSVTIVEVKEWCKKLHQDLEDKLNGKAKETNIKVARQESSVPVISSSVQLERLELPTARLQPILETVPTTNDESGFSNTNDYGLPVSKKESEIFAKNKKFLFWFQKKCIKEVLDKTLGFDVGQFEDTEKLKAALNGRSGKPSILVIASTGTGKTYIKAGIERRFNDIGFLDDKTWGLSKVVNVTRSTVVEQDKRVFNGGFGLRHPDEVETINVETLRSRAGQMWVQSQQTIVSGEEKTVWKWKPLINPVRLHLDECQFAKNPGTQQHDITLAYFKIETPTVIVWYSATPFTRVSEAKAFAISTKKDISHMGFPDGTCLSETTWATYAQAICGEHSAPDEYNEAAVERLMKDLDDYIVRVKGVRWQFNAINGVEIIDFEEPNESNNYTDTRHEYAQAWQRYLDMMAKLERQVTDNPRFQALVELGIFLAAAEYAKRYIFAKRMYEDVKAGKAAVLACKYKKTIIAVCKILNEKYGVSRDLITLVWGGGQTALTAKQKLKAKVRENKELFEASGITMQDMMLDEVEDRTLEELPAHLRLGNQSKEERQKEIDKFQSGRSLYAIYTFKAGGVGLSLHHTDEQTAYKVRRQKNGYAIVEDIVNVPTRPRKTTVSPTWSPIEMVQGVGRVPRLTSLSDSIQTLLFYRGTVEEEQAFVVTHRLKCLTKVVRQHESWQDLITNHVRAKEIAKELVEKGPAEDTEEEKYNSLGGDEEPNED